MANEWSRGTATLIPNTAPNHTIANAMNAIGSFLTQTGWELALWSSDPTDRYYLRADRATQPRWRYEGDGPIQHCGIHISQETGDTEIHISTFLENLDEDDVQVDTRDPANSAQGTFRQGKIVIAFDVTAPNNYLFVGGEDGLYIEAGRDGASTNLGHGWVATFAAIAELNATKDAQVRWMAQGIPLDLFGSCKFVEGGTNRNRRFVVQDGTNRNFTAFFAGFVARGSLDVQNPNPADYQTARFGNRDLILGQTATGGTADFRYGCCFGQINSPEDDRYRISPILMIQDSVDADSAADSSSVSNSVDASPSPNVRFRDIRHDRQLQRVVVVDYTLLPSINITEAQTGRVYRVVQFADNGRSANLGIEWPSSTVTPAL